MSSVNLAGEMLLRSLPRAAPRQPFSAALRRATLPGQPPNFSGRARPRFQSSSTGPEPQTNNPQSWFQRSMNSPIGLKTVHFWAPVLKWALVIAGLADFARPVESLSLGQNFALTATGLIWTRWCLIIKPRNILLAAVNFFLGMVGLTQLSRIAFHASKEKLAVTDHASATDAAKDIQASVANATKTVQASVTDATKNVYASVAGAAENAGTAVAKEVQAAKSSVSDISKKATDI